MMDRILIALVAFILGLFIEFNAAHETIILDCGRMGAARLGKIAIICEIKK